MSIAFNIDEKSSHNTDIFGENAIKFEFDFKALFLPIMQKNRRSNILGAFLLLFHFLLMFSLQIHSSDFPIQTGLMPSIHYVLSKFNILYLISALSTRVMVMYVLFGFNLGYLTSMIVLGFLSEVNRKNTLRNTLTKFHVYCFQIYNWVILIPSVHISSNLWLDNSCDGICKILNIFNIILSLVIANFIEYSRININFKCEDSLDSRVDIIDRIMINFKIFVVISAGIQFYIDYWLILLFLLYLADYFRKINYYIEIISDFYLSCILCFLFTDLVYFSFYNNLINLKNVDISYLLLFGCSFLLKTAVHLRGFLIIHKLKRIAKMGIRSKLDFDLYIRETYSNLHHFETNLESKILFLSFFGMHQNKCKLKECVCKTMNMMTKISYLKNKKMFKKVIESYFIEYLSTIQDKDFEDVFLMYCSFITNILKIPSKSLKYLMINKSRIKSLKNRILIDILIKKSKKSLEKKLLNNDQYAQSFSTVIFFDHQIRVLESSLRHIIVNELQIGSILLNHLESTTKSFDIFVDVGKEVNISIEKCKEQAKKLFDLNANNVRLTQLTTLIIKYLSEDMSFRNFYKQLNIKKINQEIQKRKKKDKTLNIFDNDAGVIFISLSKDLGFIKRFSKNVPKIFHCDSMDMKNKNIEQFMPLVFARSHDMILNNFVNTGKAVHLVTGLTQLYGITKENLLLHINLIIRLDTFFSKDFMIGGFIKTLKNSMSKTILLDIHGNFINCSKEILNYLNFSKLETDEQHKISMILLIPDIMDKLLPSNLDDISLKRNTDFKMKGFLLSPLEVDERNVNSLSIKKKVYGSFKEFQELDNHQKLYQDIRTEFSNKLDLLMPQDFKFYRIHFTLIIQNFRSNFVNVRLIEIFDILEISDMKLQIQYLSKKSKIAKNLIKNEEGIKLSKEENKEENEMKASHRPVNQEETKINHELFINSEPIKTDELVSQNIINNINANNSHTSLNNANNANPHTKLLFLGKEEDKLIESYLSITNRTEIDRKLKNLNEILIAQNVPSESLIPFKSELQLPNKSETLMPSNPFISSELDEDNKLSKSEAESSDQNLLNKPVESQAKASLSTIEQEDSELSYADREDQNFEEKISQMSNELMMKESDEAETLEDENTHTRGGSQVSRVSSHASGDGKKSTLDVLNKVGVKKIQTLKVMNILLILIFFIVTIVFYVLINNETFNLETTLKNSGVFHNQISPLCILVRDSIIFKFLYSELIDIDANSKKEFIGEISSSLDFNNLLLSRAYKTGIGQADSSVDFVYLNYVNVTIENITLYTIMLNNSTDPYIKHFVPIKLLENNLLAANMNIPECILFFLSAAQHLYYSQILNIANATDSENYVFFLQENILAFINSMLDIIEINKQKIGGSVSYLGDLNLAFFLITLFSIVYGIMHTSYISIKSKFKANKFCSLFFHFQEKEIDDRSNKLRIVLDKYFDQKNSLFVTDISNLSRSNASRSKKKMDMISTDKLNLLKSENFQSLGKKHHRSVKRSVSVNQIRGKKFQVFLIIFFTGAFAISSGILGLYISNYVAVNDFSSNIIEITGDLESVESYVLTLHIQYAANSILLGLYDETPERRVQKMSESDALLEYVDTMQSKITDLGTLFKVSNTEHILTQLKYEFFTKDVCELYNLIKENINNQIEDVQEIANRLKGIDFCQRLLKNVLTKGSTSFAFEINEIFKQWQDYIRQNNYSSENVMKIIQTQEFLDINYALPYIYALGLYDINLMMTSSESYFETVRNQRVVWFILTLIVITFLLIAPYQKLIRHLNTHSEACFSLIKIFPFVMISNNKMLENKITRITRQQKI